MAGLMAESGLAVEQARPIPRTLARDPDWPGSEVDRTTCRS